MDTRLERYRNRLLKHIDKLDSYADKMEYLNGQFLKADSKQEAVCLDLIKRLKNGF